MNNENPSVPAQVPPSDLIPCHLNYHRTGATVYVDKRQIFKLRPESLLGVYIKIDLENQSLLQCPPFVAFQMRITSDFEIKQMGDGFPCKDEDRAKELMKVIEEKNVNVPRVVLANWAGHFGLVTMANFEVWYEGVELFVYHHPKEINGQLSKYSVRKFKTYFGKSAEITNEEMLTTTDPKIAEQLFREKGDELQKNAAQPPKTNQSKDQIGLIDGSAASLMGSQLLVLSRAFPETVRFMEKLEKTQAQEVYDAFKRDVFALTGKMDESLLLDQQQFDELSKRLRKNRRNKQKGIDPIEYELVGGWFFKGYANMTPEQRRDALQKMNLSPPSAEAIRKICERLKLPPIRKPGRIN